MKTNAIVRIILFSIAILVLCGILLTGLGIHLFSIDTNSGYLPVASDGLTSQGAVGAAEVENIEIEWVAGTIVIQPEENTDLITISETDTGNDKYRMVYKLDGRTLVIQFCEKSTSSPSFGITNASAKGLMITVPADWRCNNLEIDAVSADAEVYDMTIGEASFEGASGMCNFGNCTVNDLEISTASGDVNFIGAVDHMDCEAVSGNCYMEITNTPESLSIEAVSGDLELYLPRDCGFTAGIDAMNGRFSTDFETFLENGHHVSGSGDCEIDVSCMSGDVNIRKNLSGIPTATEAHHDEYHSTSGGRHH